MSFKMPIAGFALAAAVAAGGSASAREYRVIGLGNESCGSWTAERRENSVLGAEMRTWVLGFVTAEDEENNSVNEGTKRTDAVGIWAWIDNYCASHPLDDLSGAADALSGALAVH